MDEFIVAIGALGAPYKDIEEAVEEFKAQVERVQSSARCGPGTTVELWTYHQWTRRGGAPIKTWTKGADE